MVQVDITRTPTEIIAHGDLTDMPDVGGVNADHDARYLMLSGANADQNINIGAFNFTATDLIATDDVCATDDVFAGSCVSAGSCVYAMVDVIAIGHVCAGCDVFGTDVCATDDVFAGSCVCAVAGYLTRGAVGTTGLCGCICFCNGIAYSFKA